ncbi:MAG: sugar phosphate isomerase/epimerase family protein [Candidatus Omnitrophota bacterium]
MSRLILSTAWNCDSAPDAASMIREIKDAGFDKVELNFALTSHDIYDIISIKGKEGIEISSVHNYCPMPAGAGADEASPDYYPLSSQDESTRKMAVEATKTTIDTAKRLGGRVVILHLGRVEIKDRTRKLASVLDIKRYSERVKKRMAEERAKEAPRYFEKTVLSVEELIEYAKRKDIILGIENRYYYREIPSPDEIAILLDKFTDRHIGYWHDVGHAQLFENLGIYNHKKDFLDRFSSRLIGVHIHDIRGIDDHRAPLQGDFDFSILKPYIKTDTYIVMEVQFPADAKDIKKGAEYLKKLFGETE